MPPALFGRAASVLAFTAALAVLSSAPAAKAQGAQITVFAAASLQTALDAIAAAWQAATGNTTAISYAGTSALARQIEQGAPADVFISADLEWMDYVAERNLIDPATRTSLLSNRIVLVAAAGTLAPVEITPALDLAGLLSGGRLAVADTEAVPAGRYARTALESLGLWAAVADRLVQTENVRAALALVSRGEAPLGIVYATDDAADPTVEAIGIFAADTHPPIVYPAAVTAASGNAAAAAAFVEFLRSPAAQCVFEAQGFTVFAPDGTVAAPAACG